LDEPVLRAALSKAASERRGEVKSSRKLVGRAAKPVERRLIRMLAEAEGFRHETGSAFAKCAPLPRPGNGENFCGAGDRQHRRPTHPATEVAAVLEERDRRLLFEILFEETNEPTWEEAISCIEALQNRQAERELAEANEALKRVHPHRRCAACSRRNRMMRRLAAAR